MLKKPLATKGLGRSTVAASGKIGIHHGRQDQTFSQRSWRYYARLVVPNYLRKIIGKTEQRSPLGAAHRQALKLLPGAVTQQQYRFAKAERKAGQGRPANTPARYPMAPD